MLLSNNLDPQNHRGHAEFRLGTLHCATDCTALGCKMPQNPGTACWDHQSLLQVTAPRHGAEPKVRALRSHTLHGLAMVFPARSSQGCMTLEGHSHWDAPLNTPRSRVKVPWDAPGCGEAWEGWQGVSKSEAEQRTSGQLCLSGQCQRQGCSAVARPKLGL